MDGDHGHRGVHPAVGQGEGASHRPDGGTEASQSLGHHRLRRLHRHHPAPLRLVGAGTGSHVEHRLRPPQGLVDHGRDPRVGPAAPGVPGPVSAVVDVAGRRVSPPPAGQRRGRTPLPRHTGRRGPSAGPPAGRTPPPGANRNGVPPGAGRLRPSGGVVRVPHLPQVRKKASSS